MFSNRATSMGYLYSSGMMMGWDFLRGKLLVNGQKMYN